MMISPFESAEGIGGAPNLSMRLLKPGSRDVSRLEFHSIDEPEVATTVELDEEITEPEIGLKEEVGVRDGGLRTQEKEIAGQIEAARNEARAAADREWNLKLEDGVVEERAKIFKAIDRFHQERTRYFASVESEVVKLALAIAARILHREAKLDPLLLAGVVKVALGKIADGSTTVLRVPTNDLEMWRGIFATTGEDALQLVEDESLKEGECRLDTSVGRVELGVSAQLQEIERGFFDLLRQRPA